MDDARREARKPVLPHELRCRRRQLVGDLRDASGASIAGMVYLGAVPTALAFSTWAYALARTDAGELGITTYLGNAATANDMRLGMGF